MINQTILLEPFTLINGQKVYGVLQAETVQYPALPCDVPLNTDARLGLPLVLVPTAQGMQALEIIGYRVAWAEVA